MSDFYSCFLSCQLVFLTEKNTLTIILGAIRIRDFYLLLNKDLVILYYSLFFTFQCRHVIGSNYFSLCNTFGPVNNEHKLDVSLASWPATLSYSSQMGLNGQLKPNGFPLSFKVPAHPFTPSINQIETKWVSPFIQSSSTPTSLQPIRKVGLSQE